MSTTLNISKVGSSIVWDYENVQSWANSVNQSQFSFSTKLTQGTAAGQADRIYVAQITLAASGTTTLTLSALTDMFGNSVAIARVKALYLDFSPTPAASPANVAMGGAVTHPAFVGTLFDDATAKIIFNSGSNFSITAPDATGLPVVSSTSDQLEFANQSGSNQAIFNLAIAGCSV